MILSDAIVTCLRDLDLRYLFGVSGANIEHVHDSVYRLGGDRFQTIMTKSEYGAAFMADARARTQQTLGVCCATSGGGMMNLAVGIAESYAHSVPVVALVGQSPLLQEGRGSFQDSSGIGATINAEAMWKAISKFTCKVTSAESFWSQFYDLLTKPMEGRKGPAVMLLPRDVMALDVGDVPDGFIQRVLSNFSQPVNNELDESLLSDLWQSLQQAKNPVLILGSGVVRNNVADKVLSFVEASAIPVVSTLACPGVFPNHHPRYLGMIGVAGHPSAHAYIEETADLVICIGSQLKAMTRASLEAALSEKELWVFNDDFGEFDYHLNPTRMIELGVGESINKLLAYQRSHPIRFTSTIPQYITCYKPETEAKASIHSCGLTQSAALRVLNNYLPEQGHILFDAGNCAAAAAHFLKMPMDVTNTIALGMGGMGYAIAGAVGAQLGEDSDKRTVVFCGDGAFMMTGLEIHTAVDLELPILWVVFNNNMHGMCVTRQKVFFEGRIEGNTYGEVSIARIASGFGGPEKIWSSEVSTVAELEQSMDDYLENHSHKPGVIELKIQVEEIPPFTPFLDQGAETEMAWV